MENDSAIFCERSFWTSNLRCTDLQVLLYAQSRVRTLAATRKWSELMLVVRSVRTSRMFDACRPSITTWSIWFLLLISGDCQVTLWILRCWNLVLEIIMFCAAAKDASLKPLSLVFWCRLCFPTVGPKIPSLSTFASKSPSRIFIWDLGHLLNIILARTPEIGQGLGRILSCGARKPEQT